MLDTALAIMRRQGPEALTFGRRFRPACGLSASTLVQRFESKARLIQAALSQAWDRLDRLTLELAESTPNTP